MQIETFNHAESTGDAQEKQAHSCELALAENKKFVDSRFGAHLFQPLNFDVPDPVKTFHVIVFIIFTNCKYFRLKKDHD
jgi:hypothetical protein